jgi:hypothetical protein
MKGQLWDKGDNGRWQPNYSNVFGDLALGALSNACNPAGNRGMQLTIDNSLINTAAGAIGGLTQEFIHNRVTSKAGKAP